MDTPVFLTHFDPAGAKHHIALDRYNSVSTFYLPDLISSRLSVSRERNQQHANIRLDVHESYCLLSVWSGQPEPVIVLADYEFEMAVSTPTHRKSVIITEAQQFVTSIGRWQVEWDRSGSISQSMQPLPVPDNHHEHLVRTPVHLELLPSGNGKSLMDRYELEDMSDQEDHVSVPVIEIRLPPLQITTSRVMTQKERQQAEQEADSDTKHNKNAVNGRTSSLMDVEIENDSVEAPKKSCVSNQNENFTSMINAARFDIDSSSQKTAQKSRAQLRKHQVTNKILPAASKTFTAPRLVNDDTIVTLKQSVLTSEHDVASDVDTDISMNDAEETNPVLDEGISKGQKTNRISKRRLCEVEHEFSQSRTKRRNTSKMAEQGIGETGGENKIREKRVDVGHSRNGSSPSSSGSISRATISVKSSQPLLTKVRKPIKSKEVEMLQPIKPISTPARKSTRFRSATPASSTSAKTMSFKYGKPAVVFGSGSAISKDVKVKSVIEKLGGKVVANILDADVLCFGNGTLKKTGKFIIAVAKGKHIVTDDWVRKAYAEQKLPNFDNFLPVDDEHERQWNFSLSEALERGRQGLNVLAGIDVHVTPQLRRDLGKLAKDLRQIALALGAVHVHSGLPKKDVQQRVLVVGSTKDVDPHAAQVGRLGHKLYGQEVLTMAALRGRLEMDSDEFTIEIPVKDEPESP